MDFDINYYLLKLSLYQKSENEKFLKDFYNGTMVQEDTLKKEFNEKRKQSLIITLNDFSEKTKISESRYRDYFKNIIKEDLNIYNISQFIINRRLRNNAIKEFKEIEKINEIKKRKQKEKIIFDYELKNSPIFFSKKELIQLERTGFAHQILYFEPPKETMKKFIYDLKFDEGFYFYNLYKKNKSNLYGVQLQISSEDIGEMFLNMLCDKSTIYNVDMIYNNLNDSDLKNLKEILSNISVEEVRFMISMKKSRLKSFSKTEEEVSNIIKRCIVDLEKKEIKECVGGISTLENKVIKKRRM